MMRQLTVPLAVAFLVVGIGALLQGSKTDRWGQVRTEKLLRFTESLNNVPLQIGSWYGVDNPQDEQQQEQFKASNCDGFISRTYENRETGERVNVFLVTGTARHITIHTPEWCYQGAGYLMENEPYQRNIECQGMQPLPQFLIATFLKEEPTQVSRLRIFWSFTEDGRWRGPRHEKPAFAGRPALYKVYLISEISRTESPIQADPAMRFVQVFMPELNRALFEQSAEE